MLNLESHIKYHEKEIAKIDKKILELDNILNTHITNLENLFDNKYKIKLNKQEHYVDIDNIVRIFYSMEIRLYHIEDKLHYLKLVKKIIKDNLLKDIFEYNKNTQKEINELRELRNKNNYKIDNLQKILEFNNKYKVGYDFTSAFTKIKILNITNKDVKFLKTLYDGYNNIKSEEVLCYKKSLFLYVYKNLKEGVLNGCRIS